MKADAPTVAQCRAEQQLWLSKLEQPGKEDDAERVGASGRGGTPQQQPHPDEKS